MDIISNHISEIICYKTKFVELASVMSKKLQYGDDLCCNVNDLYLASQLINRLDCYTLDANGNPVYDFLTCIKASDLSKLYEVLDNLLQ